MKKDYDKEVIKRVSSKHLEKKRFLELIAEFLDIHLEEIEIQQKK